MKKILATILALVLALGLTATVWAEGDGTASGNMTGADFLAKAKDGVITLTNNVSLSTSCSISDGQTYTINLNGYTLSAGNTTIMLRHGKLIVNGTGTIKENSPYFGAILVKGSENSADENYSVVEVNAGVTLEGWSAIFVDQNAAKAYGVSVTVNGAVLNGVTDNEGGIGNGLYVNGSITHTENAPEISLKNTTITATGEGMYLAGYTTTTLTNCNITGMTGVEIRAGKLTVNGGNLKATAAYSVNPNGNGSTTEGAAIAIAQHTTKKNIEVTLNGGTYTGEKAISESNPQRNDPTPQVAMSVTAGTFVGDVVTADVTNFISGGTFASQLPESYLAESVNYEVYTNGEHSYFANIDDAVAAAGGEGQVTNVKEEAGGIGGHTVVLTDNGSVVANLYTTAVSVNLPTLSKSGYTFKGWKDDGGKVHMGTFTLPSQAVTDNFYLTAVWSANSYYYYPSTSDTTTSTTTKGSPKTFDAGVGIYAVTAVLSVTGMAWTAKKRH